MQKQHEKLAEIQQDVNLTWNEVEPQMEGLLQIKDIVINDMARRNHNHSQKLND